VSHRRGDIGLYRRENWIGSRKTRQWRPLNHASHPPRLISTDTLPSGDTIGAAAVAFHGSELFVLSSGGGCTHANPDEPPGVVRADLKKGTWTTIVDLGAS
jgi:hypothetical protein